MCIRDRAKNEAAKPTVKAGKVTAYVVLAPEQVGKPTANVVINDWLGRANTAGIELAKSPITPEQIGRVVNLQVSGVISSRGTKDLLDELWKSEGGDPAEIVDKLGMKQMTDTGAIEKAVDDIIAANPEKVEQAKAKPSMLGWFVGQVMKSTGGKANPAAVNDILKKKLGIEA